jgi:bacteriophage HK97-gp10 putative tail-component
VSQSRISFSFEAIGSEILRADFMVAEMEKRANRIKAEAEARAPVYDGPGRDPHRGRYKESIRVESTDHGGDRHDRAEARAVADSPEAIFVEKGARAYGGIPARPGQHIMAQAMMAAGDE